MFYIRTADRLQRTSVWLDNLEGGLDYLKRVVLEDHLGICSELESEMAHIVETYQCEWKTTVDKPQQANTFSHFVNSEVVDSNVVFVREREQIRPTSESAESDLAQDILATG
jgi:nitrite reductase (NADH) large subunit